MTGLLDRVRSACARVTQGARFVRLDEKALGRWVEQRAAAAPAPPSQDPAHAEVGDAHTTLAYVFTIDAINFGSGWFPVLRKREGCSGYLTIAGCLKDHFLRDGPWSAAELSRIDAESCAAVFGQSGNAAAEPLMELFGRALNDLGAWLEGRHGGHFHAAVEAADASAEALAEMLAEMPLYRDVSPYRDVRGDFEVPLYKRAQITASDLSAAFGAEGPGRFDDLERLTIFADNLVPHVLRREGVLVYAAELAERIERGVLLAPGSPEEVEIRAVALHAVERAVAGLRSRGIGIHAGALDHELWNRGQAPEIKAHPRHRCRSTYY